MPEVASQTLDAVGRELNATIAEARAALESYVEQPQNVALLGRCHEHLHQVYGALRVLEIYGASLLAEEMEQVAAYLLSAAGERKSQAESLDALMRAMVQLPPYLERVLAGGRDLALVLLPLANDLRAVRGAELLSEGTLLLLNLKSDEQPRQAAPVPGEPVLTVEQWARKLRSRFQLALVGWLRGEHPEVHLESLAAVAAKLEEVATRTPVFQLWWVFGAVIEALREEGLARSGEAAVRRLLGLGDREIRRLYELGEARYAQVPPVDLLNSLLYYVGQARSDGGRIAAVRESFRLAELLPVDDSIDQERDSLSAPSVNLMQTVAAAIREDLSRVKDVLDIFVRRGASQPQELGPQVAQLRKMADTLAVLSLGELRARVQGETDRLEKIVAGRLPASEATLMTIAATLIEVENALDDQLVGTILPNRSEGREGGDDKDFQQVQAALLKECILNLARVKELIAQAVAGSLEADALDAWQAQMKGMQAGLLMLGKARAVEVISAITAQLKRILQPGSALAPGPFIDRLADAIVSVEYYMETLQAGRSDPWYMLDNAQGCVQALEQQMPVPLPVAPLDPASFSRTVQISVGGRVPRAPGGIADPELLKLFIEEAHEEITRIQRHFPVWDQNAAERESLVTVRRSFHTLKGSGRMVGAASLSEFAWAIENLLNRLLDNTLERTPAVITLLREAVDALPYLITSLESGAPLAVDAQGIGAQAHGLAGGSAPPSTRRRPAVEEAAEDREGPDVPVLAASHGSSTFDDSLREIYSRETSSHVATVREYLARESRLPEPHFLPEDVYRACHTLSGSSKMAQARHGIRLAEPLDHWLRRVFASGVGLRNPDLAVLADCMAAMESVVSHLDEPTGYFVNHSRLAERIVQADKALDARITQAPPAAKTPAPQPQASPLAEIDLADLGLPDPARDPEVSLGPESSDRLLRGETFDDEGTEESELADFDPEVAAIFGEEAMELLDASQEALMHWRTEPHSSDYRSALKRPLHTLKGGARMAGLSAMGDLSHELETLVMQIDHGMVLADERVFEILQASLDELARMREHIAEGNVIPPPQMIARIQALYRAPQRGSARAATADPARAAPPRARPAERPEALRSARAAPPPPPPRRPPVRPQPRPDAYGGAAPELEITLGPGSLPQRTSGPPLSRTTPPSRPPPRRVEQPDWGAEESASLSPGSTSVSIKYSRNEVNREREEGLVPPQPVPPGRDPAGPVERQEMARVDAELLDTLLNTSGEASIARARLEQQVGAIDLNIGELSRTVIRLKEQLRSLEIETEAQIRTRHVEEGGARGEFDPLELDRYSAIQQFSRALAETANDMGSLQSQLETLGKDALNLLQQQTRMMTELQNGLMRTRMVPFQRHVQRLARIVRQAAADTGKRAELIVEGASGELDRQVLERMLPPFEHMLRNSVVHGIEGPQERARRGKPEAGRVVLEIHREGAEVMVRLSDDGAGMNMKAIRDKGVKLGLIAPGQNVSDEDAMQLILEPGFSTAGSITQQAGRGVGMDVVATEIKRLGGALHMETKQGEGTVFTIRLPFTLAISTALVVRTGDEYYALPLPTVESVLRLSKAEVMQHLGTNAASFEYGGQKYRFQPLSTFVGLEPSPLPDTDATIPVVLVRAGEHSSGLVADELVGSREIVVKSVGPQISNIRGISGATILGDGRIVIILDIGELVRAEWRRGQIPLVAREKVDKRSVAMVVDDSITVRKVTQRLLERNDMRVILARDGMEAVALLADNVPDVILLDIEMPRMDGYEVAAHVRNDPRTRDVPIIMITSRVGEKHRSRAVELGVDDYLGKPYQEAQLLKAIRPLVARHRGDEEIYPEIA